MPRLKIPRPPKWVLVRHSITGELFVLDWGYWNDLKVRHPAYNHASEVATSNNRDELERFKDLTKES